MALDNKIRSGEYDNFEIAQEDADKEVKTLDDQKSIIEGYKNSLDNESVFAGPACESCIKEMVSLITNITLDAENFNTIKSYLDSALNNYLDADAKAVEYLDIKDGKVIISKTSPIPGNTPGDLTGGTTNSDFIKSLYAEIGKTRSDYSGFTKDDWCGEFVSQMLKDNGYDYEWARVAGNDSEGILKSMTDGGAELHYGEVAVKRGQASEVTYTPQAGDVFTIDTDNDGVINHTGFIVKDNGDGTVTTLEGNTFDKVESDYNGGVVQEHIRPKSQIYAYATPKHN